MNWIENPWLTAHLLADLVSVIASTMLATMAWHSLDRYNLSFAKVLVAAFFFAAGVDVLHMLDRDTPLDTVSDQAAGLGALFWQCGRMAEVIAICVLLSGWRLPGSRLQWLGVAGTMLVIVLLLAPVWLTLVSRDHRHAERFSLFKMTFEMVALAATGTLAILACRLARQAGDVRYARLAAACIALCMGQLALANSHGPADSWGLVGHLCSIVACGLIYAAAFARSTVVSIDALARSASTLRVQQAHLDALVSSVPAKIMHFDAQLRCDMVSRSLGDAVQRDPEDQVGLRHVDLLPADWQSSLESPMRRALAGERTEVSFDARNHHGAIAHKHAIVLPERSLDGEVLGVLAMVFDRTQSQRLQQQLVGALAEADELRATLDAHAIVAVTDARGVITRVNERFCLISQYTREELLGSTHRIINSGCHPSAFFEHLWQTISSGQVWNGEICNRAKDGSLYWVQTTIVPFIGERGVPVQYIAIRADITQQKTAEHDAQRMALYDILTGLPNRRLMADRLRMAKATCARTGHYGALMLLDLDNFKEINDTLGHDQGDELLRQVAMRLMACVRQVDSVARIGGDEFAVVIGDVAGDAESATDQACVIAEKVRAALSSSYAFNGLSIESSTSIGMVMFRDASESQEELLKHADMALYRAKASGRNKISVFDPSLQDEVLARASLVADLRQALTRNELCLYYQPIVNAGRLVIGQEALLRWFHPHRGLVAPGDFIVAAEQTGLILPIGQWVLHTACAQLRTWSADPAAAQWSVAVNVSARQFRDPDFVAAVRHAIELTGADPKLLRLELTESMLHTDLQQTIRKMEVLKGWGIRFSLDDFGTGYSSLSYLKILPLAQLKIDRAFVRDITLDANDAAIAHTILALARTLGLSVVAEGVETQEQFAFLDEHGCDAFQGYLFGKPAPSRVLTHRVPLTAELGAG